MTQQEVEAFVAALASVERAENLGYIFFFYGSNHFLPIVSIAQKDNEGDSMSNLNREGVFRVNIGVSKQTFDSLFPDFDPEKAVDYTALDVFLPHPHYARQFYICILNPSEKNDAKLKEYMLDAYALAKKRERIKRDKDGME